MLAGQDKNIMKAPNYDQNNTISNVSGLPRDVMQQKSNSTQIVSQVQPSHTQNNLLLREEQLLHDYDAGWLEGACVGVAAGVGDGLGDCSGLVGPAGSVSQLAVLAQT